MWEFDHKQGWASKYWCFRIVMLEKTLQSPLDSKEIKLVNQPWIFIGRTNAEAEAPRLWPLNAKSWLTRKDPDAGKNWGQEEKGTTEDEMIGWYHRLNGHKFEQTLEDGKGRRSLASCSPWGHKELDVTQWLSNNNCFCLMFWFFGLKTCGILTPWPGIELAPLAMEGKAFHWTAREVPPSMCWTQCVRNLTLLQQVGLLLSLGGLC